MDFNEEEFLEMQENSMGFCQECGEWTRDCTEPDAEDYDCPACGQNTVVGADNYLLSVT